MVDRIRALVRLVAIVATSLTFYGFLVATAAPVGAWRRLRRDPRGSGSWRARVFRAWARTMLRLLGFRVDVRGRPPRAPFLLVSNHLGYTDVLVLASRLHCVFVSRADVRDWPVVGRLCRSVDTLFLNREAKRDIPRVLAEVERTMRGGRGVVVFPEGTSSGGADVLPFRPSLLEPAAQGGVPVSWAVLSYRTPAGSPPADAAVCWWGDMPFAGHVWTMMKLPWVDARLEFGPGAVTETDRKELARRLHEAVRTRLLASVASR